MPKFDLKSEIISPNLNHSSRLSHSRAQMPFNGSGMNRQSTSPIVSSSRKRKTHINEQISSLLRRLPKLAKQEQNRQIEDRNLQRELKHARHLAAPDRYPEDASDCSSLITLSDDERPRALSPPPPPSPLPPSPTQVETSPCTKRPRDPDDDEVEEQVIPKKRRIYKPVQEISRQPGEPIKYPFHYVLHHLAQHNIYMPLSLFTFRNIANITRQVHTLRYRKLFGGIVGPERSLYSDDEDDEDEDDASYILDVVDFQNRFGSEEQLHPAQWFQAAQNYIEFMALRDSIDDPSCTVAKRWEDHFNFFRRQEDIAEKFDAIKEVDVKLRQLYFGSPFSYDPAYYEAELQTALLRRDFERNGHNVHGHYEHHEQSERNTTITAETRTRTTSPSRQSVLSEHSVAPSLPSRIDTASVSGSATNTIPMAPKRQRNRRSRQNSSPAILCLVCGRPGHYFSACRHTTFLDGQPTFVEPTGGNDIVVAETRQIVCRIWNVGGDKVVCFHSQNNRAHLCSFCGDPGHHAFSWTCKTTP